MARKNRWGVELTSLKQNKTEFQAIAKAMAAENPSMFRLASDTIKSAYQQAALLVRDKIRDNEAAKGVPRRIQAATFAFLDFDAASSNKNRRSTLVGVRTGAPPRYDPNIWRAWGKAGGRRAMSLARIFESGTHRGIKPRRYFRSAIFATRGQVLTMLSAAYQRAVSYIR